MPVGKDAYFVVSEHRQPVTALLAVTPGENGKHGGWEFSIPFAFYQDARINLKETEVWIVFQKYDVIVKGEGLRPVFDAARKGTLEILRPSPKDVQFKGGEKAIIIDSIQVEEVDPFKKGKS